MSLSCQQPAFALEPSVHYLNGAAYSPGLHRSVEKGLEGLRRKAERPFTFRAADHFETADRIRSHFARLLGSAEPDRVALLPAVSYGMAIVARNLHRWPGLPGKRRIVLIGEEFPNNVYTFERAAAELGLELHQVERPEGLAERGARWNAALLEAVTADTALVVASPVHWIYGTVFDLEALGRRCRGHGAMFVIDATQGLGIWPFDHAAVQPDALICAAYKWLLGPYGTALAWFGPFFDDGIPLEEGWMNRAGSEQFAQLTRYERAYRPKAQRYNAGEYSQFAQLPVLEAALDQLLEWQPAAMQEYCRTLIAPFLPKWAALGCQLETPAWRAAHLFRLELPGATDYEALLHRLADQRIYVSVRGGALRVSPNVYNSAADLEALTAALAGV